MIKISKIFLRAPNSENLVFFLVNACFLLSGFSALLYQSAWLKKLTVVFGSSSSTVAIVLAAYMGGLALGAAVAARFANKIQRSIIAYGLLEGLIAVTACLVPLLLTFAGQFLIQLFGGQSEPVAADGIGQSLYYLIATFIILSIPTAAMGATLPMLARYAISKDSHIAPRIGLLYSINTLGAVIGTLIAGFFLLPYFGLFNTLLIGAGVNFAIFLLAFYLDKIDQPQKIERRPLEADVVIFHKLMPVMLLSGSVSFMLEVLWTRLLSHIFGGTIYAFSIMLASFLFGIAAGGFAAGRLAGNQRQATNLFVTSQILIAVLSFLSFNYIDAWVPVFSGLGVKAVYSIIIILPSTFFIGMTYPLAVKIACDTPEQASHVSGRIYAWNTVGAIIGSLLTGFFLLPLIGFVGTIKAAVIVSLLLGFYTSFEHRDGLLKRQAPILGLLAFFIILTPSRPDGLIHAYMKKDIEWGEEYFYGVGRTATILMREAQGFINLSSNGLSESSIGRKGMPPFNLSQKWLSGLPALARPEAQTALIVGYGGGIALEGIPPNIRQTHVIELEPMVIEANKSVSGLRELDPLSQPSTRLVVNDARNAIMLTGRKYDIIVSQPSHPWTGGASHLYTREFLQLAKEKLSEDGVFLQWINSQFVDEKLLKILTATIVNEFNYVELYQPERQVLMFVASQDPIDIWQGNMGARKALNDHKQHYARMGAKTLEDIVAMTLLDSEGTKSFAAGQPVNTDNRNYLAFFSRAQADGLNAEDLADLFNGIDPLTNPDSHIHKNPENFNLAYIAETLLQANFLKRTSQMGRAARSPDQKATIDALGYYHSGEEDRAAAAFSRAMSLNPDNKAAQLGLLRAHLGDFARQQLPAHIAKLANQQKGPERRVLEGWVYGSANRFDKLEQIDNDLAAVEKTSLAYPIAVKLRVDWRIIEAQKNNNQAMAREALNLLDDLLASYWNIDLYTLRAAASFLADKTEDFVETVATVTRQLNVRLRSGDTSNRVSAMEAETLIGLLQNYAEQIDIHLHQNPSPRVRVVKMDVEHIIRLLERASNS